VCCIAPADVARVIAAGDGSATLQVATLDAITCRRFAAAALLAAGWLVATCQPVQARPAQVLLMRHGHKGSAGNNYNLSPTGFQRALGLASVIPACFGTPSHITTYFLDPETSKNARSYQTAVPLAVASGVNIRIDRSSVVDSLQSGRSMLSNPAYSGGLLVVFWEHRHLPQLAAGLGWPEMPPIADNDFDLLYRLRYGRGETTPQVSRFSQSALLDGSQPCSQAPVPFTVVAPK
jgi:hypothetical protein